MARTQAADYDDRRDAILKKAASLYAETGFLGTSIADLAQACAMTKSLLYYYFSSKEDILFEIMDNHVGALKDMASAVPHGADATARLAALTHGFMELYRNASAEHKVLVNDLDKLPEERRAKIVASERALVDIVDEIVSELTGPLAPERKERRAATMIYFGMINWTHTWFTPEGGLTAAQLADLVTGIYLKGLPAALATEPA